MLGLWIALLGSASAADWGEPKPYVVPRLSLGYVSVNGQGTAQGIFGGEVGVRVRDKDKPHWLSISRLSAVGLYGFSSGSLGGDFRLGSFFGIDGKAVRLTSGPDIFFNGYGVPNATDYHLPWSPGVDIRTSALFKIHKDFKIEAHVVPGWAFASARAAPDIPVFTHVSLGSAARINAGPVGLTVGVERQINSAGTQDYIILGAGI